MPITVHWKHILLDPAVFESNGTYRVARIRGGVSAFPIPPGGSGSWDSAAPTYSPVLGGSAPNSYDYRERTFVFGFWSVKESYADGRYLSGSSHDTNNFTISFPPGNYVIEATAYYYWNFGDGGGEHAVYLDAFDDTSQEFIPDDFVDVIPDEKGNLTMQANNGSLPTGLIDSAIIRARNPTGDNVYVQYQFNYWVDEADLSRYGPETVPVIAGRDIRIRRGSVIAALAHYSRIAGAPIYPLNPGREGGQIIGIPADGPFIFIPFGGHPRPVGPFDPMVFASLVASGQVAQLASQIADIEKRVESLEKANKQ